MKLRIVLALAALGFSQMQSWAQAVGRIEFPTNDDYEDEWVLPLEEHGVLVQMRSKDAEDGKRTIKSELYSTDMKLQGSETFSIPKKMWRETYSYVNGVNYTVMRDKDDNLKVLAYDTKTGKTAVYDGKFRSKLGMREFCFGAGGMVFAATDKKTETINVFNFSSGQVKTLDLHFDGVKDSKTLIFATAVVDENVLAFVNVAGRTMLVRMGMDGKQLGTTEITPADGEAISSA